MTISLRVAALHPDCFGNVQYMVTADITPFCGMVFQSHKSAENALRAVNGPITDFLASSPGIAADRARTMIAEVMRDVEQGKRTNGDYSDAQCVLHGALSDLLSSFQVA